MGDDELEGFIHNFLSGRKILCEMFFMFMLNL